MRKNEAPGVNDLPSHLARRSQSWGKNSGSPAPELGQYSTKANACATKAVVLVRIGNQHLEL